MIKPSASAAFRPFRPAARTSGLLPGWSTLEKPNFLTAAVPATPPVIISMRLFERAAGRLSRLDRAQSSG